MKKQHKPRLYLKMFLSFTLGYGLLTLVFNYLQNQETSIQGLLFQSILFGIGMSVFFIESGLYKFREEEAGNEPD